MSEQGGQSADKKEVEEKLSLPDVPLHPNASKLVRDTTRDYAASLVLQAKLLAFKRKEEEVLGNDVEDARDMILQEKNRRWSKELAKVVGAGLFGAFVPGFLTQLSNLNGTLIADFTLVGIIGLLAVAWGLR